MEENHPKLTRGFLILNIGVDFAVSASFDMQKQINMYFNLFLVDLYDQMFSKTKTKN